MGVKTKTHVDKSLDFLVIDYRQMELYFQEMSQKGWRLVKVNSREAKFEACESGQYQYCIDFADHCTQEYMDTCKEQGWEVVGSYREKLLIFEHEGAKIQKLQSDEYVENEILESYIYKKEKRKYLFIIILWILLLALITFGKRGYLYMLSRYVYNEESHSLEASERVSVEYAEGTGDAAYMEMEGGEEKESTEEAFDAFYSRLSDARVINFTAAGSQE